MFKISSEAVENFIKSEFKWKPTNNPKEIRIKSIYVQDEKFKCYINIDTFQFCDFKSGNAGSCYYLFSDYLDMDNWKDILVYIMKNYAFEQEFLSWEENNAKENIIKVDVIKNFINNDHPIWFSEKNINSAYKTNLKYLSDRKIDVEYIRNMGFIDNDNSIFDKRIIIPYFENNEFVYFQARATGKNAKLRYLNPAGLDTKSFVFNYDKLNDDELIVCEGPFDAMSFTEQTSTCLCSGDLSSKQITKIFSKVKPKNIIFVVDQDETGIEKIDNNIQRVITYADYSPNILVFNPTDGCKDMNELKIKTGKDFILKKECERYNKNKWRQFNFGK